MSVGDFAQQNQKLYLLQNKINIKQIVLFVNCGNLIYQLQSQIFSNFKHTQTTVSAMSSQNEQKVSSDLSLTALLSDENVNVLELLSISNILPKIKNSFSEFVSHCQTHEDFCFNLIDIGIKCPMHEGSNQNMKSVCFRAADILTCDQDIVADLFILPNEGDEIESCSDDQFEKITEEIDMEAQSQEKTSNQTQNKELPFSEKYKFLMKLLEYIETDRKNIDENCINYMVKALNCVIRKKIEGFYEFLAEKEAILDRILDLNDFSSINQMLIKLISEDQIAAQYLSAKKKIVQRIMDKLKQSVSEEDFICRLDFLDELFQTNKYSSDDQRSELQTLSDVFVSQDNISFFYQKIISPKNFYQIFNSCNYLLSMVKRMITDEEADPYSYSQEPKEQTMLFHLDLLFKNFDELLIKGAESVQNLSEAVEPYNFKLLENKFYELLCNLTKHSKFNNCPSIKKGQQESDPKSEISVKNYIIQNAAVKLYTLKKLITQFGRQLKNGVNRQNILTIIEQLISLQIYADQNHKNEEQVKEKESTAQNNEQKPQPSITNQQNQTSQVKKENQSLSQENSQSNKQLSKQEKKKNIEKIKSKLKLSIKKLGQEGQSMESPNNSLPPTPQVDGQPMNVDVNLMEKMISQSDARSLIEALFQSLRQMIVKWQSESKKVENDLKKMNRFCNESEWMGFLNKLICVISCWIYWDHTNEQISNKKSQYVKFLQQKFFFFRFDEIPKKYATRLAIGRHPNGLKIGSFQEMKFLHDFINIYHPKINQPESQKKPNNKQGKLELSDSDFISDDDDDDEPVHAVKCSLEDFKRLTGFKEEVPKIELVNQNTETVEKKETQQVQNQNVGREELDPSDEDQKEFKEWAEKMNQEKQSETNQKPNKLTGNFVSEENPKQTKADQSSEDSFKTQSQISKSSTEQVEKFQKRQSQQKIQNTQSPSEGQMMKGGGKMGFQKSIQRPVFYVKHLEIF